jgi:hypothetical protein
MRVIIFLSLLILNGQAIFAQQKSDSTFIRSIYDQALTNSDCYNVLRSLCKDIGPRLSGSENAAKSVTYMEQVMKSYGFDRVYLQEVMVPHWRRIGDAKASIIADKKIQVKICALGGSVATPAKGITAEVIEVQNFEELDKLGEAKIKGKIVFFIVKLLNYY